VKIVVAELYLEIVILIERSVWKRTDGKKWRSVLTTDRRSVGSRSADFLRALEVSVGDDDGEDTQSG
jgi:hypothetical protein